MEIGGSRQSHATYLMWGGEDTEGSLSTREKMSCLIVLVAVASTILLSIRIIDHYR
jgi:hypothetical protein